MVLCNIVSTSLVIVLHLLIEFIIGCSDVGACPLTRISTFYNTLCKVCIGLQCITQLGRIDHTAQEELVCILQSPIHLGGNVGICNSNILHVDSLQVLGNLAKGSILRAGVRSDRRNLQFGCMPEVAVADAVTGAVGIRTDNTDVGISRLDRERNIILGTCRIVGNFQLGNQSPLVVIGLCIISTYDLEFGRTVVRSTCSLAQIQLALANHILHIGNLDIMRLLRGISPCTVAVR